MTSSPTSGNHSVRADVIVLGLGAMGSASLYQLAKRNVDVVGIDQFSPPHHFGSTHGDTRITRLAIGEGAAYVPLVTRSHQLWRELEAESGDELLNQCGGIIFGPSASDTVQHGVADFLQSTIDTAKQYGIRHELLNEQQLQSRFPQFRLRGSESAYFEHDAGYVRPEACVAAQLAQAESGTARVFRDTKIHSIERHSGSFRLISDQQTFETDQLVLSAGSWLGDLIGPALSKPFSVYRQVMYWFEPSEHRALFEKDRFPIFIWVTEDSDEMLYGFPETSPGSGVKVATERFNEVTHPETRTLEVSDEEKEWMSGFVQARIPWLSGPCLKAVSCLYTCTPDFSFVIDQHPDWPNCLVVSPCSGHGFKHSAAIGEVVAEQITTGQSTIDVSSFSFSRLRE
jgi:sarcosine oxidase